MATAAIAGARLLVAGRTRPAGDVLATTIVRGPALLDALQDLSGRRLGRGDLLRREPIAARPLPAGGAGLLLIALPVVRTDSVSGSRDNEISSVMGLRTRLGRIRSAVARTRVRVRPTFGTATTRSIGSARLRIDRPQPAPGTPGRGVAHIGDRHPGPSRADLPDVERRDRRGPRLDAGPTVRQPTVGEPVERGDRGRAGRGLGGPLRTGGSAVGLAVHDQKSTGAGSGSTAASN